MPERPVGTGSAERRLAAILSADVAGYSRLMAENEAATVHTLTDYREEIGRRVEQHRGRVVDTAGDSVLAEFPTATDAVRCAVEIQGSLGVRNAALAPGRRMEFRIGVHLGEVRAEGERIYGDGLNIAARLQALAEPGGICLSRTVRDQVEGKLALRCEDLGERSLKNIPRPVHAYRIRVSSEPAASDVPLPGMEERTVPGFHGAPAIAVLPFENLSGDPEQEYFADGIAEDLITRLSTLRTFPVIARNSSFTYKGKAVDVKQVSRELGVRYVVEGSVRKAGDRVRISAQLIDATTGVHIWAERYDRELVDIFAVQDEITEAIAGSMRPGLDQYEQEHAIRRRPRDPSAWDCTRQGWWHLLRLNESDNAKARSCFERAADLDPSFANAFVGLAWTHFNDLYLQWTESRERSLEELLRAAEKSVTLDPDQAETQVVFGVACQYTGKLHEAIAALERAVELDPSMGMAHAFLGSVLSNAGRPDEAIASTEKAMRLSPHDPLMWEFLSSMGVAHFVAGRYEEAVHWLRRSIQRRPDWPTSHRFLAASYAHLGRLEEARAAFEEMKRRHPQFSLAWVRFFLSGADPAWVERYVDGLRKAGLEE